MIPTQYAERSVRAANELLPFAASRSAWSWRPWRRVALRAEQLKLELTIPRAVAAAEDFLLMRVTEKLHPTLLQPVVLPGGPDPLRDRLRKAAKNFGELRKIWSTDLGVDVLTLADWPAFERWRELRHVLVHRLGYWQPGLDEKTLLRDRIIGLGQNPDIYRGVVPLATRDLKDAVATARAFVLDSDAKSV